MIQYETNHLHMSLWSCRPVGSDALLGAVLAMSLALPVAKLAIESLTKLVRDHDWWTGAMHSGQPGCSFVVSLGPLAWRPLLH